MYLLKTNENHTINNRLVVHKDFEFLPSLPRSRPPFVLFFYFFVLKGYSEIIFHFSRQVPLMFWFDILGEEGITEGLLW